MMKKGIDDVFVRRPRLLATRSRHGGFWIVARNPGVTLASYQGGTVRSEASVRIPLHGL